MTTVHPLLGEFAFDLARRYDELCANPKHDEFFRIFGGIQLRLYTEDGLTLKFWEEGVEFYPETEEVA